MVKTMHLYSKNIITLIICLVSISGYSAPKTYLEDAYEKIEKEFGPKEFFASRLQNFDLRTMRSRSPAFERHRFLQESFSFGYFLNPMFPDAGFYSFRSPEAGTSTLSFSRQSLERSGFYETNPQAGSWIHGIQTPLFQQWIDAHYRHLFAECFKNPESIDLEAPIRTQLKDEFEITSSMVGTKNFLEVRHASDRSLLFLMQQHQNIMPDKEMLRVILPASNGAPIILSNRKLGFSNLIQIDLATNSNKIAYAYRIQPALLKSETYLDLSTALTTHGYDEVEDLKKFIPWEPTEERVKSKFEFDDKLARNLLFGSPLSTNAEKLLDRGLITQDDVQKIKSEVDKFGVNLMNDEQKYDLDYLKNTKKQWNLLDRAHIPNTFYGGINGQSFKSCAFIPLTLADVYATFNFDYYPIFSSSVILSIIFGGTILILPSDTGSIYPTTQKTLSSLALFFPSLTVMQIPIFIVLQKINHKRALRLMTEWIEHVEMGGSQSYLESRKILEQIRERAIKKYDDLNTSRLEQLIVEELASENARPKQGIAKPDLQHLLRIQPFGDSAGGSNPSLRLDKASTLFQYLTTERDLLAGEREPLADLALRIQQSSLVDSDKKFLADSVISELKKYPGDIHKALLHADLRVTTELMVLDRAPVVTEGMACSSLMHFAERFKSLPR